MNKQNIITITLIITGLALNPLIAEEVQYTTSHNKNINQSITSSIAKILHKRGLDEDVADEMATSFVKSEDEILLAMLIQNLETHDIVTKKEVLEYLSNAALHKQNIDFKSYDHILGMVHKIKQKSLDAETRRYISHIVKINKQLFV